MLQETPASKHIAICLWGICRSSHYTYGSFKENIIDKLTEFGFTYDIFLHTYRIESSYTNGWAGEHNIFLNNDNWQLFNPTKYLIENNTDVDNILEFSKYTTQPNPWNGNVTTFNNHIRALYSLKQVTSLWTPTASSYYAVMYCRPDVQYLHPLEKEWFSPEYINTCAQTPNFSMCPINDRFCLGSPSIGRIFGERFNDAYEFSKQKSLHSEQFLWHTFNKHGIKMCTIPFNIKRIRANGRDEDPHLT